MAATRGSVSRFPAPPLPSLIHNCAGTVTCIVGLSAWKCRQSPGLAAGLKLPGDWGVIVSDIAPGSPAEAAGLKVQDIITSIDGRSVENLPSLASLVFMRQGGERIRLGVLRGAEKLTFDVQVVEVPHDVDRLVDLADPGKSLIAKLGVVGSN